MWKWICSACGAEFVDLDEKVAEELFLKHAREAHNPKLLISTREES